MWGRGRGGNSSALNHCVHCGLHAGWCLAVGPVPWGNCASPSPPSQKEGVALLVARTCDEVVPAHKEFLRACRQTPVPLICIIVYRCLHALRQVPGRLRLFSFFILRRMGKIKSQAPTLPRMYQIHVVFRFNPRSRCNSSSRCWYRAREHVDPA